MFKDIPQDWQLACPFCPPIHFFLRSSIKNHFDGNNAMHVFDSYCYCWMLSSLMFQCLWPTNTSLMWCDQMRWKQCMYLTTIDIVCWFQFWRYSNAFDPQIFWDLPHPPWIWYNLIFNKTYLIFFWPTITAQISLIRLKGSFGSLNTLTSYSGGSLWVRSK